jgi:hypothetical protein
MAIMPISFLGSALQRSTVDGHRILTSLNSNGRWNVSNKQDQKCVMNDMKRKQITFDSSALLQ